MKIESVIERLEGWVKGQKIILNVSREIGEPSIAHEKLMEDVEFLINEIKRMRQELVKANNHMDEDHITIQRYKKKLAGTTTGININPARLSPQDRKVESLRMREHWNGCISIDDL